MKKFDEVSKVRTFNRAALELLVGQQSTHFAVVSVCKQLVEGREARSVSFGLAPSPGMTQKLL
jgi:hypothetical protein